MRFFSVDAADRHRGKQQRFRHVSFLASGHHCPGMAPGSVFLFCFAAPSARFGLRLGGGALAAAFGGALSLRTVPRVRSSGSGMLPSDAR
jgi:hypothetical protein